MHILSTISNDGPAKLKSWLETFLDSCNFFVTFTVFQLFSKNWFDATNVQISWNSGLKFQNPVTLLIFEILGKLNNSN